MGRLHSITRYECDICGKVDSWSKGWAQYSSILLDGFPGLVPTVCSDVCIKEFERRLESKTIVLPKISRDGRIIKKGKGYGPYLKQKTND